jgi:hypothetical protein
MVKSDATEHTDLTSDTLNAGVYLPAISKAKKTNLEYYFFP